MPIDQNKIEEFKRKMLQMGKSPADIDTYIQFRTKQYGEEPTELDVPGEGEGVAGGLIPGETAGERERNRAIMSLRADATKGVTFTDLLKSYYPTLTEPEIRNEYDKILYYQKPAKETREETQRILGGEKETMPTEKDKVRGFIINAKNANTPIEEIHKYIRGKGFDPSEFADILEEEVEKPSLFKGLFEKLRWPAAGERGLGRA